MKGDDEVHRFITEALLCKMFKCTPSELYDMDWEQVEYYKVVFSEMIKQNPMSAFM